MNEDFVPFELAVKLKEKGFREKCIAYYWEKINEHTPSFVVEDNMPEDGICILDLISEHNKAEWSPFIDAPTISQVLKWLKEEKKLHIGISPQWKYMIYDMRRRPWRGLSDIQNYDDDTKAVLAGIEYVIDNLI